MPHQAATLAESFDNLVTLTRHINNLQLNHAASQPRGVASRHQGGYTIAQGGGGRTISPGVRSFDMAGRTDGSDINPEP